MKGGVDCKTGKCRDERQGEDEVENTPADIMSDVKMDIMVSPALQAVIAEAIKNEVNGDTEWNVVSDEKQNDDDDDLW